MTSATNIGDWSGELAVTGLGLVTPVGLKAEASIAALRAGISRLCQLPGMQINVDKNVSGPVLGALVPHITQGRQGIERIAALMKPALAEVLHDSQIGEGKRIALFLGTSGARPCGRTLDQTLATQKALQNSVPAGVKIHKARLIPSGRASVLQAIRMAAQELESGHIDLAIVGAADSWVSPRELLWLRKHKKLAEYPRRTGTMPGEAAGFLALEQPQAARARGAKVYSIITDSAGRHETAKYGEPSNALALAESVRSVFSSVNDPYFIMITDQNGERYRALEWVLASPKALNRYDSMNWLTPANCIGDSGAACGSVMLAWAASALAKGHAGARNVLIWGTSDEGAREAVRMQPAGGNA